MLSALLGKMFNFTPVKLLQPNRYFNSEKSACLATGLSMFEDKVKARAFFRERIKKFPRFTNIVGSHIATLNIDSEDGVASIPEELNFGHITFHEYLWCDFYQKVIASEPT